MNAHLAAEDPRLKPYVFDHRGREAGDLGVTKTQKNQSKATGQRTVKRRSAAPAPRAPPPAPHLLHALRAVRPPARSCSAVPGRCPVPRAGGDRSADRAPVPPKVRSPARPSAPASPPAARCGFQRRALLPNPTRPTPRIVSMTSGCGSSSSLAVWHPRRVEVRLPSWSEYPRTRQSTRCGRPYYLPS